MNCVLYLSGIFITIFVVYISCSWDTLCFHEQKTHLLKIHEKTQEEYSPPLYLLILVISNSSVNSNDTNRLSLFVLASIRLDTEGIDLLSALLLVRHKSTMAFTRLSSEAGLRCNFSDHLISCFLHSNFSTTQGPESPLKPL